MDNHTLDGRNLDPVPDVSPIMTTFAAAVSMSLCSLVGLFGNTMSTLIFLHPLMVSPVNILLAGLSLIDLIMILLSILVLIVPSLNLLVQNAQLWNAYGFTAVFLYPLCTTAHTSSIWTFVLVSIERYNATCKPLKRHKLLTCRQARLAQTCVVLSALCYNCIRFWEYKETRRNESLSAVEPYLRMRLDYLISYYTVLYILTHFALPFTIILLLNTFIIRSVRYSDRYIICRTTINGSTRQAKQQRKTTNMIVVITLMFAACNTFPFILNIFEALHPGLFYGPWKTTAYVALDISNALVLFNSSITFVIYLAYCRRYRVLFKHFTKSVFRRTHPLDKAHVASDPCFRRYSVVNNSGYESGVEMTVAAYTRYVRRYESGRRSLSIETTVLRLTDPAVRKNGSQREHMNYAFVPQSRGRVYTQ